MKIKWRDLPVSLDGEDGYFVFFCLHLVSVASTYHSCLQIGDHATEYGTSFEVCGNPNEYVADKQYNHYDTRLYYMAAST